MSDMEFRVDGTGVEISRSIGRDTGQRVIEAALQSNSGDEETLSLSVESPETSFSQEIPESAFTQVATPVFDADTVGEDDVETADESRDELPDDFFRRLTARQRAMLEILIDDGGWMTDPEIRQRIQEDYEVAISDSGSGSAGIIAGFTRKYDEQFKEALFDAEWTDNGVARRRIGKAFKDELEEYFADR